MCVLQIMLTMPVIQARARPSLTACVVLIWCQYIRVQGMQIRGKQVVQEGH